MGRTNDLGGSLVLVVVGEEGVRLSASGDWVFEKWDTMVARDRC